VVAGSVGTCFSCRVLRSLWTYRDLAWRLLQREVRERYRSSLLGIAWAFFNPLLSLLVFAFVFGVIFESRWDTGSLGQGPVFSLALFAGLLIYFFFAEVLTRSGGLILGKESYVKKVVFPLEVLSLVTVAVAALHLAVGFLILLAGYLLFQGAPPWTALFLPLIIFPLALFLLGLSWFVSSLTVYLRDLEQLIPSLVQLMMFLSCVFYPVTALPDWMQSWVLANPLALVIDQARGVLFYGRLPAWGSYGLFAAVAVLTFWAGAHWFERTRKGFADVM
jgi:lipopolysaccharide transport system permease protein